MKKLAYAILFVFVCAWWAFPQSLAELAEREKARRAACQAQKKKSVTVTNADLAKYKKRINTRKKNTEPAQKSSSDTEQAAVPSSKIRVSVEQEMPQEDQRYNSIQYASKVLPSTRFVEKASLALRRPDGQFAEISLLGLLDIEIEAVNGPGDDISVYSRLAGFREVMSIKDDGIPMDMLSWGYHTGGYWFAVLGMTDGGEWVAIGRGLGRNSPETFDLGSLPAIKKLRIMFKPHTNADLPVKNSSIQSGKFTFGIDAIEALH